MGGRAWHDMADIEEGGRRQKAQDYGQDPKKEHELSITLTEGQ